MAGWVPFKDLNHVIRWALSQSEKEAYFALEEVLKKHRPDFTNLLQNPAKCLAHRQKVKDAPKYGLNVPGLSAPANLPPEFVEEALILSDILDLNEISSVELLLAGEQHMSRFPGLTRGLVAVLLYHDGRQCLLSCLRNLIQAREGVAWTLGLPPATHELVMSFTDGLLKDGLVNKILSLLDTIREDVEMAALEKGRAIGGPHHRKQLLDLIKQQRNCLADCLFLWSVQNPLCKDHTLLIINHLRKIKIPCTDVAKVTVDMVTVSLCMTVMSCFNIGEGEEELITDLYPILTDPTFISDIHSVFINGEDWKSEWVCAAVKLSWAILLREYSSHNCFTGSHEEVQDDEALFDDAVSGGAFAFLWRCIQNQNFHEEEYFMKKLHWMLTSMIINMPLKMRNIRNRGDEICREISARGTEGSFSQKRYFEDLLRLMGDLYRGDPSDLCLEFWTNGDSQSTIQRRAGLHKFLGLCADLVPANMFSSLLQFLTGLSSSETTAYHCFEFLKSNSPSLGGGGASAAISLDHFFASLKQYYLGLRQEGVRLTTPTGCAISPQEVEGLISVLKLIRMIAQLDGNARIVMYESQQWLPVASLFGLVGCPIPRELKAEVLRTLAAFARTPDIASSMIHTLENVQVLNTIAHGGGVAVGGAKEGSIQVELEEIESQVEEYPLTRAFLVLMDSLTDVPLPPTLGAGHRLPGFMPYLEFIRDSVLLQYDTRSYQKPHEKWQIAHLALQILKKLLNNHEISLDDFNNQSHDLGGGVASFPVSPGHTLLVHMLNDSQLLKKVLSIIDECGSILLRVGIVGGKEEEEEEEEERESVIGAALLALQIVESALKKQEIFFSFIRQNNLNVMVTPLDKLLLGINPRSGLADHFINIASYLCLTQDTPELALAAINILIFSSSSTSVAKEMAVAISNHKEKEAIVHGFVEHLEWEESGCYSYEVPEDPLQPPTPTVARIRQQVQLGVLRLLSLCVDRPSPNIAHLLLGYETKRGSHISEVLLQDPGILGSSHTLLHSILHLLHHSSHPHRIVTCHYGSPKLAEICYKVLYQLCSHRDLSTPTLRYLRNNHDFFYSQLSVMPLDVARLQKEIEEEEEEEEKGGVRLLKSQQVSILHQQSWLLKMVAMEMKMTSQNQLRSHNLRLVELLLREKVTNWSAEIDHVTGGIMSDYIVDEEEKKRRKIINILDSIQFSDVPPPELKLNYFNQSAVESAIVSCEIEEPCSGLQYTDVKQLYQMMQGEVSGLRGVGASAQKHSLLEEIQHTLEVVVLRNSLLENRHGNSHLFQSWRQSVEIALYSLMAGEREGRGGVAVLFELIQCLLKKVSELYDMSVLNFCEVEGRAGSELSGEVCRVLLFLSSHLSLSASTAVTEDNESLLGEIYSAPLHSILKGLLHTLLHTPGTMQLARSHLYGAVLYYFSLSPPPSSSDKQGLDNNDSFSSGNLATIAGFGEALKEIVCRDASSGHDVTRMLSLSLLDCIVSIDRQNSLLKFMVSHGYLAKLCAGLVWEDEALQKILNPLPDTMRPLYVHQSRMALLCRLAHSPAGTTELLSANCIQYLIQCHSIKLHGLHDNQSTSGFHNNDTSGMGFVPSISDRYRQLLLPVLRLLLTMLTCPGAQGSEVKSQVTSLIGAHSDTFTSILKSHQGHVTMATLEELSVVTGLISRSGVGQDWKEQSSSAVGAGMMHIQRLMISLLPYYCDTQLWSGLVTRAMQEYGEMNSDPIISLETRLRLLQICSNILDYCRVAMTMGGKEYSSPYCRVIFSPDLMMSLSTNQNRDPFSTSMPSVLSLSQALSMGHLIQLLRQICEGYDHANDAACQTQRKISNWSSLAQEELFQLISPTVSALSLSHQQSLARRRLKKMLTLIEKEMALYSYITENLVYILWRHLQFYLVHCKPGGVAKNPVVGRVPSMRRMDENPKMITMETNFNLSSGNEGVSVGDIETLKMTIGRCLPSSTFQRLLDMEEGQQRVRPGQISFIQALVHRIRKLVKLKTTPLL